MDKQINTLFNTINTKSQETGYDSGHSPHTGRPDTAQHGPSGILPINTRTIGAPEGIYILYLEDYVHTFLKKLLSDKKLQAAPLDSIFENTCTDIALYGRQIEENGRYRIVVSGAALLQGERGRINKYNDTYFPSCSFIGSASISLNKDAGLRIELTLHNTKVILDDFYIYYDQNEEMQNYLVEWNKTPSAPAGQETRIRKDFDDAARLGRIAQAYNREEAKVSFMWNVMNVMCLAFVVCAMAYGIISVNNYSKMQSMQANIDYCMNFIVENTSLELPFTKESVEVSSIQQNMQAENQKAQFPASEPDQQETAETIRQEGTETLQQEGMETLQQEGTETIQQERTETIQQEGTETIQQEGDREAKQEDTADTRPSAEAIQALAETNQPPQDTVTAVPQYYIVQPGDTLRTICYEVYGNYSRVDEICRYNNIKDPDNILYGQKLLLP